MPSGRRILLQTDLGGRGPDFQICRRPVGSHYRNTVVDNESAPVTVRSTPFFSTAAFHGADLAATAFIPDWWLSSTTTDRQACRRLRRLIAATRGVDAVVDGDRPRMPVAGAGTDLRVVGEEVMDVRRIVAVRAEARDLRDEETSIMERYQSRTDPASVWCQDSLKHWRERRTLIW